jgi:hypothetical protein
MDANHHPQQPSEVTPRKGIPEAWAKTGHCPACGALPLQIVHTSDAPDYLLCPKCELSFEVAENASLIRIKNLPESLEFAEADLRHRWVAPQTLKTLLEHRQEYLEKKQQAVRKTLSNEEAWQRALGLYKMGNKPKMIQYMLIQGGASQAQAELAFNRLQELIVQDSKQETRHFWVVAGVSLLLVVLMVTGGWAFALNSIDAQLLAGVENTPTGPQALPVDLLRSLPDPIKPEFLKSPPSYVDSSAPINGKCPQTAKQAAQLFGGQAANWERDRQMAGWKMATTGAPVTIRIPSGMPAGYIENATFEFRSVVGPATIHNVNFIVVSCE